MTVWRGKVAAAAHQRKRNRYSETDVPTVLKKLDAIMALQMDFIELGERAVNNRRLQLLWILLQANLIIVLKAYHLVMYIIHVLVQKESSQLTVPETLLYYGFPIISEALNVVFTIVAVTLLTESFQTMLRLFNKFLIYAENKMLRSRLSQFSLNLYTNLEKPYTVYGLYPLNGRLLTSTLANAITYIVILIQYSLGDACSMPEDTQQSRVEHQ